MEQGRFRADLYYRLNVVRIELPPLRERREDIPLLVEAFIKGEAGGGRAAAIGCSPLATRLLQAHDWPGNVRQLFAALESATIRTGGGRIEAQHLPEEVRAGSSGSRQSTDTGRYRKDSGEEEERRTIVRALAEAGGHRSVAAERLGMSRTTLWRRMKRYGLELEGEAD
jgi:DNA-binding NtrC family response regulator